MRMRSLPLILAGAALAGCAGGQMLGQDLGPLAQFPAAQQQIKEFYDDNAVESDWQCTEVEMNDITRAKVASETASTMVVAVHYEFQESDVAPRGGECQGFNTRFFTFSRAGGGLTLEKMSGEQRQS
jgi:hypothetical protein